MASRYPAEFVVHVRFEQREDGGLRARCDKIPNFFLSHSDPARVHADVIPALETILSAIYEMPMRVTYLPELDEALDHQPSLPPHVYAEASYKGSISA